MSTPLEKTYTPSAIENKWYAYWMENGFFHSKPNATKEPFTIVIPPPNVTGVLHMGHMLNNTIQDVLIRRARMQGKEACWVPGTDHASIATEAKVVAHLKEKGIRKSDLSREDFLSHAWEWKTKYGGIILDQLKSLGASCDWSRTAFTMDPDMSAAVIEVFVRLYQDGLIYRGHRMVNWDPEGKTALSDEEVIHKEVQSKLYHLRYPLADGSGFLTIATTRPETLLGDTAVCVHPEDERYMHLHGKQVLVPLVNRSIPIITDTYVEREFGTGCLKVTPAHDMNDFALGQKHKLEVLDIMHDDGRIRLEGSPYDGIDRFEARKRIVKDLQAQELLEKIEDIKNSVGYSERTNAVVEPRLSLQWFVNMKAFMAKYPQVLDAVMQDEIKIHPPKFKNTYRHWIENIKDWCISRQLWWGQRIPAYYLPDGQFVVAMTEEAALIEAQKLIPSIKLSDLRQDEDVLDTWFSSWLWPISVFNGFKDPNNEDIRYYYPTHDLVTAPEILFFWVARMIMAGYAFQGKAPFTNVYLTGIVRDKQGRKMSKSLGNSPDPLDLMAQYGADGVRFGMLLSSPAGNDLLFDEKYCEQGRNFCNKLWNAFRLIQGWETDNTPASTSDHRAKVWMQERFSEAVSKLDQLFAEYRLSEALMEVYKLIWDDYCSWYLEMIKPAYGSPISSETKAQSIALYEELCLVLHPFMPFLTEEIWQQLNERKSGESIMMQAMPAPVAGIAHTGTDYFRGIVSGIRNIRNEKQLDRKFLPEVQILASSHWDYQAWSPLIEKLALCQALISVSEKPSASVSFLNGTDEVHVLLEEALDPAEEAAKIQKEMEYLRGFLVSVEKKLGNERFVASAPAQVVELERKKMSDAASKLNVLEETLQRYLGK
jgi:valyl-tRNA synthetase